MATAFALMERYSQFQETLAGAADKAKAAAEKVRAQVAEQTKGLTLQTSLVRAREQLVTLLPEQLSRAAGLEALEEGQGAGAAAAQPEAGATKPGQPAQTGPQAKLQTPAAPSEDSSQPLLEELNQACNLTFKQRVYGFAGCLGLGLLCTIMSLFVFFHPVKFGLAYSLGNLLSMGSTGFLIGFKRQMTMMFDPVRRVAAAVFVAMVFVTLIVAVVVRDPLLCLVCILVQGSALLWYSMSYIPYAQAAAKRMVRLFIQSDF